jgi:Holliday junction resolvase
MTEHDTQQAIIDLIRMRGGIATRVNSGSMISKRGDKTYKVMLADKGTSDIIALYKGMYIAIEVKHGKNDATREQLDFLREVAERGGVGLVAYDIDIVNDVMKAIDQACAGTCESVRWNIDFTVHPVFGNRVFVRCEPDYLIQTVGR